MILFLFAFGSRMLRDWLSLINCFQFPMEVSVDCSLGLGLSYTHTHTRTRREIQKLTTTKHIQQPTQPAPSDVLAYTAIFSPTTSTPAALKSFASNARKGSLRMSIAEYLMQKWYLADSLPQLVVVKTKKEKAVVNPYLDFWAWSSRYSPPAQTPIHITHRTPS